MGDRSRIGKNNRRKGHQLERDIVKIFRDELGFKYCKSSRAASKLLDDCGIDIALNGALVEGMPLLIQAKQGYERNRPKPDIIFKKIRDSLNENFPENHPIHSTPKILIHRIDGKDENNFLVTMTMDYFKIVMQKVMPKEQVENTLNIEL